MKTSNPECKYCHDCSVIKRGFVRKKQRYACKKCGYHFVEGDERTRKSLAPKKALSVLLYSLGKASYGMLGKLFDVERSTVYRWIKSWIVVQGELSPGLSVVVMLQPSPDSTIK